MSKNLETLDKYEEAYYTLEVYIGTHRDCKVRDALKILSDGIMRLKELENENQEVKNVNDWLKEDISQLNEQLEHNSKTMLIQHNLIVKYKNAIEILKDKQVNIYFLMYEDTTLERYNKCYNKCFNLTQQEYELLNEVLGNE